MTGLRSRATARLAGLTVLAALATGCAQQPKPLYHWGGYQTNLYEYFKADGRTPAEQMQRMEAEADRASTRGAALPPGFRAHMGLLSLKLGRDDEARGYFEAEKKAFPESTAFVDSMLRRMDVKKTEPST